VSLVCRSFANGRRRVGRRRYLRRCEHDRMNGDDDEMTPAERADLDRRYPITAA
jgi:hypothetical protein